MLKNPEVRIENTTACNARCTICPRDKFTRQIIAMPLWNFCQLAKQVKELGASLISMFGFGEPLIDSKIDKKVEFVHSLGMESFITTNGSLLHSDLAVRLLRAGLTHIRFSAHGLFDNYEKVHKGLSFNNFMRHFHNFLAVNDGHWHPDNKKAIVSVSVIPMHGESVDEIIEFYKPGERVDYLEIWKPHNWTNGKEFREAKPERKKTCGRPFTGPLQINADGTMMVCCFDYNGVMTIGDTSYESIPRILNGDILRGIREKHRSGDLRGLPCETCDQLNIGDTPLLWSNRDPEKKLNVSSATKIKIKE